MCSQQLDATPVAGRNRGFLLAPERVAPWFGRRTWPVAHRRVLGRAGCERLVELRVGRIERIRSIVDPSAKIVDLSVNEAVTDVRSDGDVELVSRTFGDAPGQCVLPEDGIAIGALGGVVVNAVPVAGERAASHRGLGPLEHRESARTV